jgi:hypothetical protein
MTRSGIMNRLENVVAKLHINNQDAVLYEIADGMVAVENDGECDVYFDSNRWKFRKPELWKNLGKLPLLNDHEIGMLPGVGRFPPADTINEAVKFAKSQLVAQPSPAWRTAKVIS